LTAHLTTGILLTGIKDFKFGFWLKTYFLCLFFSLFLLFPSLMAQENFNRTISFRASGEKLSSVLDRLSASENLNFSYNPAEKSFDAPVTYTATNKPLEAVLKEILALSGHDFRLIGGQIVIFSAIAESPVPRPSTAIETQVSTLQVPQTDTIRIEPVLPLRDTFYLRDTIIRVDTIIVRDTVIVEKEVPRTVKPERPSPLREDMFRFEPDRNNGWSIMPFYEHMIAFNQIKAVDGNNELLRLTEEAESISWLNQSLGIDARFSRNSWHFTTGLKYSRFTNRFNYEYELFEGGFFRTDTIDIYYTIPQTDTIWYYVTDSTWVPLSSRVFFYNRLNRLGYLEIPLMFGYNLYTDVNIRFWLNAGINAGILTNKNGIAIQGPEEFAGIEFDDLDFNPLVFSFSLATGIRYRVNDWADVSAEMVYRQHLNSILRNYQLEKRIGAVGLKIGLVYYL
jgi:hypothetical protein